MKKPQWTELSGQQLDELLGRVKGSVAESDYQLLERIVRMLEWLLGVLERKSFSIRRLRRLLFGRKSEKLHRPAGEGPPEGGAGSSHQSGSASTGPKPRRKGHGRRPASQYAGAERIFISHETYSRGDLCPLCERSHLYEIESGSTVQIMGGPLLAATIFAPQRLRCGGCGAVLSAKLPPEAQGPKYDASAASVIAGCTYGAGLPYNRIQKLQDDWGVPVPASTQFEQSERVATAGSPVVEELIRQGAQSQLFHNDDTKARILELGSARPSPEPIPPDPSQESPPAGVFTSSILSSIEGHPVALFFTGPHTAGQNLAKVLQHRADGLSAPIHMCDGLSANFAPDFAVLLANCLCHGRRKFYELTDAFPIECRFLLESLAAVYHNDSLTKEMSADDRLLFHQQNSAPIMDSLQTWVHDLLDQKQVEPNSRLGCALRYMRNRWDRLTLFLRQPGAPLDNNVCERALKMAILRRKNSYFYKTLHGAWVGDTIMSLFHTCRLSKVNPFRYMTELLRHVDRVREKPAAWFPWNYELALAECNTS